MHPEGIDVAGLPTYTAAELAERNGSTRPEIWTAYQGLIYDVTTSKLFAGGKHFRHAVGLDLTEHLEQAPHTDRVFKNFPLVGRLID
mgnify:CR=1 FL=1